MAQNITQRFPFTNKGVVQKIDINQLQDGQYSLLLNAVSEQEGSLSPRYGHTDLAGTWPSGAPAYINTLHVTQVGATSSPTLYAAENTTLYKWKTGVSGNYAVSAYDIVSSPQKRVGMATYKTDQIGTTGMTYIATGSNHYPGGSYLRGMLRDSGANGATAKYWGILPPGKPADITPSAMTITPIIVSGAYNGSINISSTRASGTISSAVEQPAGSKFYKISFASAQPWLPGMYIVCGAQSSVIEKVDSAGAIFAYFDTLPSGTVTSNESAAINTTAGQVYTATSDPAIGVDLSFGATNDLEGYVTDDTVAFSFFTSTPERIYDIRLRFYTNDAKSAYYEKAISPGSVQASQNAATSTATNNPTTPDSAADVNAVSDIATNPVIPVGDVINYDPTQTGMNPVHLTPSKSGTGGWSQVEISKRQFLALGGAGTVEDGSGGLGWRSIKFVEVVIRPTTTTAVATFKLGAIFAYGGKGVNSNYGAKLTPYSYVYTYKNKVTGAESNPSIEMIPENTLNLVRQGINVNVLGTSTSDTQNFSSEVDTICIYRSGGTFADGLYRRVGVITNPGAGTAANFVDTADDLSIVGAPIAEFDNDAPVTSDIGQEYKYNLNGNYSKGSATIQLKSVSSGLRGILTPGTIVNIGGGIAGATGKQEPCIVLAVNDASFTTYLQYDHKDDEAVIWDTNAGTACDIVCSAFNRMWVAGDARNPHILYSSKTGRPEVFPVINQGTGNPHVLAVSSPDNPVNGIAEFNGELVCLCQNGIYTVRLDNGRLVGPFKTPANRGLVLKYAWGYVDNEIWFLSNDGIYAWGGGAVRKVTFAVDFIFNRRKINGIAPFDRQSANYYPLCNIQQKNNEVFFNYINTDGWFFVLRYHILFDRWSIDEVYDPQQLIYPGTTSTRNAIGLRPVAITALAADKAAGVLYAAKTVGSGSWPSPTFQAAIINYDDVNTFTDNGQPIYYEVNTKFHDMGAALVKKSFTDIGLEFTSGTATDANNTFFYKVYYDYSATAGDASVISYTLAVRQVAQFPLQQSGSPLASEGKEARAAMFSVYGQSKAYNIFHNFAYTFIPLSDTIKGRVTDWDDLGHPFDKRLFNVTIEYDNNNTELVLYLDTVGGLNSGSTILGAQSIILPAKVGRAKSSIPITADIIAKMVRLRPKVATTDYQIFNYSFQKEDYPRDVVNNTDWSDLGYQYEKRLYQLYINCDTGGNNVTVAIEADGGGTALQTITVNGTSTNRMQSFALNKDLIGKLIRLRVTSIASNAKFQLFDYKFDYEQLPKPTILSTPWNDFGYDYLKYAEQISFDVNTNGQAVPVSIYGDGVFEQTVTVTGTQADRNQIITLNPALTFRTMRLEVGTIPASGRFQLWDYRPIFRPADKGEVYHTFDWDDLGYPYDKKLTEISIEFETGAADDVRIAIDTLSGVDGTTQTLAFQTLTLPNTSGNRGFKTFPINETVCKMVRIRALGRLLDNTLPASFKMYGYKIGNFVQYPADIVNFTDWSDLGYEYEKRLYQLYVNCDTNGLNVSANVEADGGILQTVTINGSSNNRMQAIPLNKDLIGRQIRLSVVSVPAGAKFQLFDYKFDYEKLPAPIVRSTLFTDFGYDYLKYAEQISFDVNTNGQPVPVGIYGDGVLMQTVTVTGTHANRNQIITLNPALTFRTMRLEVGTVPVGGRFQLWEYRPIFRPADKGEVYHTFDWDDLNYPYEKKLTEVTIEFETGSADNVKIALDTLTGLDGATQTLAFQTLSLPNTSGIRAQKTFPINEAICKMIRIRAIGSGSPTTSVLPVGFKMYGYKINNVIQYPPDTVLFTDWSDLGYQYEKRFYQLSLTCDTNGYPVTFNVEADGDAFGISSIASHGGYVRINASDTHFLSNGDRVFIKGVAGTGAANVNGQWNVTVISTTAFMLNGSTFTGSPTGGIAYKILQQFVANATTTNRVLNLAMDKDLIGKLVRLNVVDIPAGGKFQVFDFKFDYEQLPKPIVLSTPFSDFGYDYLKYAEQIAFDVNTNGVQIPVDIYCDGVWKQRVSVEGTQQNRNFNCTLNPAITFQTMRLQINPDQIPDDGRFQLWEYRPIFRPADKGAVYHTFDWDNLEHPYDKKISEVTIEFETNGKDVTVVLDTLTGISGNVENLAVQSFTLNATGRGLHTFPIQETICKMVRIRALATSGRENRLDPDFKMWGYKFGNTVPYPPDVQRFSEWTDLEYPCDKIFRGVGLSIDTGGVDCSVVLEVDGAAKQTFTVNTTSATRQTFLTAQNGVEIIGKMYRLTFTPGAGGKSQVFGAPQFNVVKDSCPFVFLDSYEQGLGSAGYSVLKQFWADYKCDGSITIKFYNENNVLFYSKTLGPHASRDVERFYLPAKNGSVINKSKKHRITIEAVDPTKPFKWYRDTSRLEYINLSADQRQGYFQFIPWTNMQLPV